MNPPRASIFPLHAWLAWLLLSALVVLAYWPGLEGGFVFDDLQNIVVNTTLHVTTLDWPAWVAAAFSSPASLLQRPLAMLSFAANHYFTGLDPVPMKLTNLAIHALNALLVLGLVRQLLALLPGEPARREWAARFAAAAWALHPINLMAVLYVVQRMESLSHTFVFAGLWLYLHGRQRQREGRGGGGIAMTGLLLGTGLGLLAKESAVLLPLYAFCVELCVLGFRGRGGRDRRLLVLYALLAVPALLGAAWLLHGVTAEGALAIRDFTLVERLLTEPRVVLDYLRWTLLPDLGQLSLYHDDYVLSRGLLQPPATLLAILAIAALLGLAAWSRPRRPLLALGLLWFLGAQLLTGTFIPLELVYEHRNYFASLGVVLVLADLLLLAPRHDAGRRIGALLAVLAVLAFATITHLRAREWRDPYRFAATEAAKHPRSPRAAYGLAQQLVRLTAYRADSPVLPEAWRALERARQVPGSSTMPHQAALVLAARTGVAAPGGDWWQDLQRRLRARPPGPEDLNALNLLTECAVAGACDFPRGAMDAAYAAALHAGREDPVVLALQGKHALWVDGDPARALPLWRRAAAGSDVDLRYNLVRLLIDLGHFDEARERIADLRALGPLGQHEAMAIELERRLAAARTEAGA